MVTNVLVPWFKKHTTTTASLLVTSAACLLLSAGSASAAERQLLRQKHVPAAVSKLAPVGRLESQKRLSLAIGLPLRDASGLSQLIGELYDPSSANFHQWLTPDQLAAKFGATESDYRATMDWAKANGLSVTLTHPNRIVLDVEGTVADIEKAFQITLRVYHHPTESRTFFAPDREPTLALAAPVLSISGLDNYSPPHPMSRVKPGPQGGEVVPHLGQAPGGAYAANDFRAAYVPGTTLTGTGQSVALLQFDGFYAVDISNYKAQFSLPNIPVVVVPVDGAVSPPGSGNSEVCLDIEMVMSMAPGLSTIYVYEAPNPSPWVDLLSKMQTDNLAKSLSCSWGGGGPDAASENVFLLMAGQGQSFFNASGDSDAFVGSISFPSESTNITQVGGTTLSTSGPNGSYTSETVWNWGGGTGSSGGISTYYGIPTYQLGVSMTNNQGSTSMRNVPDVALTADNVYVRYNNGGSGAFGGTSCAAPLWAGFTALVNQQAVLAARPTVGFLNPAVYTIGKGGSYASAFHDTTVGNNFSPGSPSHFSAVAGYDLCTGWGTPRGTNLINLLSGPAIVAPFVVSNTFALLVESCTNNAIDPGERVTVSFGLKNVGTANTTNLVVTLQASGGVSSPSGPQNYGALAAGGSAMARSFSFTATGNCGATNTATLQLQDGATSLGTVTFTFLLGQISTATVFSQSFDGVTAPALPAAWATSSSGVEVPWVTTTAQNDTAPNSAFAPDPSNIGLSELDSPTIALPAAPAQLSFRNNYDAECSYDGGVLEIKIGAGAWNDILAAGGSFVTGGYNGSISTSFSNPLGGRQAWTCSSGGFITTLVNLPAAASGQSIQLRWLFGSDDSNGATGWYVDTIKITSSVPICCAAAPVITSETLSGNILTMVWSSVAGRTYQVQYKTGLGQTNWTLLTTVVAAGSTSSTTDLITSGRQRFYRVLLLP
jgi:subtilase family serine protease